MAYQVPDAEEVTYFEFKVPSSKTLHKVPHMEFLEVAQVEAMEEGGLADVMEAFGESATAIRKLNAKQLKGLMDAWREASAISMGE